MCVCVCVVNRQKWTSIKQHCAMCVPNVTNVQNGASATTECKCISNDSAIVILIAFENTIHTHHCARLEFSEFTLERLFLRVVLLSHAHFSLVIFRMVQNARHVRVLHFVFATLVWPTVTLNISVSATLKAMLGDTQNHRRCDIPPIAVTYAHTHYSESELMHELTLAIVNSDTSRRRRCMPDCFSY